MKNVHPIIRLDSPDGDEPTNTNLVHSLNSQLNPQEAAVVVAWVFAKNLTDALERCSLNMDWWEQLSDEKRALIEAGVNAVAANALTEAGTVLKRSVIRAALEMEKLLDSGDSKVRFNAAKWLLQNEYGAPTTRREVSIDGEVRVKTYHVDASPEIWDDEHISIQDVIDGKITDGQDEA